MNRISILETMSLLQIIAATNDVKEQSGCYSTYCPNCKNEYSLKISKKAEYTKCYKCGFYSSNKTDYLNKVILKPEEDCSFNFTSKEIANLRKYIAMEAKKIIESPNTSKKATECELNLVYTLLANMHLFFGESKLSEAHKNYLLEKGFTEEEITKEGFFTMVSEDFIPIIEDELSEVGLKNILCKIPGFFFNIQNNKWGINKSNKLCIPVRVFDYITGIQLNDISNNSRSPKYCWLSSSNWAGEIPTDKGNMLGSHIEKTFGFGKVDLPTKDYIAIVEGQNKKTILSLRENIDTFSINGVHSFRKDDFELVLSRLKKEGMDYKKVVLFIDSDLIFNINVLNAVEKILRDLSLEAYVAVWDFNNGIGIDDYLLNGNCLDEVEFFEKENFLKIMPTYSFALKSRTISDKRELQKLLMNLLNVVI